MRFKQKQKIKEPEAGETRIIFGFLWFPKKIGDERRWLERTAWIEKYYPQITMWEDHNGLWEPYKWAY